MWWELKKYTKDSPLALAIIHNHLELVEFLVEAEEDISPWFLTMAVRRGHDEIAKYLVGVDESRKEDAWKKLWMLAAQFGNVEISKWMIGERLVDVDICIGWNGYASTVSALHVAVEHKQYEVIEVLLANGSDIEVKDGKGKTPFHVAVTRNDMITAKLLLRRGAQVNCRDCEGSTPLHAAVSRLCDTNREEFVNWLLDSGADMEAVTKKGNTPLLTVAPLNASEVAVVLVKRGVKLEPAPVNFSVDSKTFMV